MGTTAGKIFLFNLVISLLSFGAVFYGLDRLPHLVRLFFYPLIGYTMLSFISAAIAAGMGMNAWERTQNVEEKRAAILNGIYIVAVVVGIFFSLKRLIA
jgi:ABC-type proline/glycine betaine transport system permease subunit